MNEFYRGRRILVTGGTGSIGSVIVTTLLEAGPEVVRIMSRDETRQHEMQQELGDRDDVRFLIGDIRDEQRLKRAMSGIDFVFHAAALKHVPSCEYNPFEAVQTNVGGTQNIINAALDAEVEKVIAISTDKAVNPVNVMGATKLLAEKLIVTANNWISGVKFGCVRFGNVLGSRGSIVHILRRQIEKGGPVTITHPQMTRFMMSLPDAVNLCLEAGEMCEGGEVFILKMPSLMIAQFADVLIDEIAPMCGIDPESIVRKHIGVRQGEKMAERLLDDEEIYRARELDKMIVVDPPRKLRQVEERVPNIPTELYDSDDAKLLDDDGIRELLKRANVI